MRNFLLAVLLVCTGNLFAQNFSGPESVEWDSANTRWLISNTTSHAILARTQSGTLSTFVANTTSGPHGIEILGNVLYACCGSSIKGYDLTTGMQVFNINLGAAFLNGLTTDGDSVLYATDFSNKDIFRINPSTNQFYVMSNNTVTTPNGIIYDGDNNRCIFVGWGTNAPVKAIDLTTNAITTITATTLGNCDGITRDHLGYYYVTAWGNQRMNRFINNFTGGSTPFNSFTLNNPADIDCKFGTIDTVGIPNAGNNTCTFIPLAPPTTNFTINDTSVCVGDAITYTNTSSNADSYSWIFGGGDPNTGTTSPIGVGYDTAGTYTVTLSSTNIYGTTSLIKNIHVNPIPTPTLTYSNDTLTVTPVFTTYQWFLDSFAIAGATDPFYAIPAGQFGNYYCLVTENGCEGASNIYNYIISGIEDQEPVHINLYPNPVASELTVEFYLSNPQNVMCRVLDISGKEVLNSSEQFQYAGPNYLFLNLNNLDNGVYIISLVLDGKGVNKRLVVNH